MADVHHALRQSAVNLLSESVLHDQQPNAMTPLDASSMAMPHDKQVATCHRFALKL